MFKTMKSKKDQEVNKLKDEFERLTSELTAKEDKHKHERTIYSDKNAIS
jgi:hypothetical protein